MPSRRHYDTPHSTSTRDFIALGVPIRRGALGGVVVRPDGVVIPTGNTEIRQGQRVIVFALDKAVKTVEKLFS